MINKIDLPSADVDRVKRQIEEDLGLDPESAILTSAKEGLGIEAVLEGIVNQLKPPQGDPEAPLQALIFDSHYDAYRGTIVHFRVFQGRIKAGDTIQFMYNQATYKVEEVGCLPDCPQTPERAVGGPGGLSDCRHQDGQRYPLRRHDHAQADPLRQPHAGIQRGQTGGVLFHLSGRLGRL